MHSHNGCICMAFLQSESSNVPSNGLPEQMHSRIGCICTIFLQSEFSNVSSNRLPDRMQNHTGCICLSFLHCVFSNVFRDGLKRKSTVLRGRGWSWGRSPPSCEASFPHRGWSSSSLQLHTGSWLRKFLNLVKILKIGQNSEIWSKFRNLVKILKLGQNSEIW